MPRTLSASVFAQFAAAGHAPSALAAERPAPPADPHRLRFRTTSEPASPPTVDLAAGTIRRVSLMTANREAAGHGVWIDQQSLTSFQKLLEGRRFKSYVSHGWGDQTLDEPGYWHASVVDGAHLRADFVALDAWRKHSADKFDTLFELAEKLPGEFGVSLSFRMALAWVRADGTEIPTRIRYRDLGGWDYEKFFDPAAPADAVRTDMPSVRAVEVYSADFVDTPAANDGLFRAGPVDVSASGNSPATTMLTTKQIHERFSANPAHVARAIALSVANDKLSLDEIALAIAREDETAERDSLKLSVKKLTEEATTFKGQLDAKDAEIKQLKADLEKSKADFAELKKLGTGHVPTGEHGAEGGSTDPVAALRAELAAVTGTDEASAKKRGDINAKLRALKNKKK